MQAIKVYQSTIKALTQPFPPAKTLRTMGLREQATAIAEVAEILERLESAEQGRVIEFVVRTLGISRNAPAHSQILPAVANKVDELSPSAGSAKRPSKRRAQKARPSGTTTDPGPPKLDYAKLVNALKQSQFFEHVDKTILSKSDLVPKTLLALHLAHSNSLRMTSGDIVRFYRQLNIQLDQPSVLRTLSGAAKQFVITDDARFRGAIMRYSLSHAGEKKSS